MQLKNRVKIDELVADGAEEIKFDENDKAEIK